MLTPSAVAAAPIRIPSSTPPSVWARPRQRQPIRMPQADGKAVATLAAMDVSPAPVGPDLRDRVLGLAPRPDQTRFAGRPSETLPEAEADPRRGPVAILEAG